ncbi:RING-type E3 ubiquitin transferase [Ranunculus cassubicifolius]
MSYSYSDTSCCSTVSSELKLYQAFIFSIPIFFTFILLFLFYLFYLRRRRRRMDWPSVQQTSYLHNNPRLSECGLNKEIREMLPIIVFKETFSIRDTLCSVCLGDYQAEDRLQQIPVCSHTFHMDCIDHWLTSHTTCPLCRLSLVPASSDSHLSDNQSEPQPQEIHNQVISECPPDINNTQDESSGPAEHRDSRISNEELRTEELPV